MAAEITFEPAFADLTYIKKKIDLSSRIANNREQRTRLKKELEEYVRIEKTGNKSWDDPVSRAAILKLQEAIKMESAFTSDLESQQQLLSNILSDTERQIRDLSEMIQRQKEEKQWGELDSSNFIETRAAQLQEQEQRLRSQIKTKEKKVHEIAREVEQIKQEIEKQAKYEGLGQLIENWALGQKPDSSSLQKAAHGLFKKAMDTYQDARSAFEGKIFQTFFIQARISLLAAIDCVFVLAYPEKMKDLELTDYVEKIDLLFAKRIVVNPTMLDSLSSITQRIQDGIEVSPNIGFKNDVMEYLTKNLRSLGFHL